jgi:ribosomal protein S18 acetylase RimI-like enzyme
LDKFLLNPHPAMPDSETIFRTATLADLPAIVSLLADDELGREREDLRLPLIPEYLAAFRAIAEDANQLLAVAEDGAEIVGTLQISFVPGISHKGAWRGQIESVRVKRTCRGAGLGQEMFAWAIAECRARNCALVQLTTNKSRKDAHRFYERLGFVASHEGFKLDL